MQELLEVPLDLLKSAAGGFLQLLAGVGQGDAPVAPDEEARADHLFQAFDFLAQRGLGELQLPRSAGETFLLGGDVKGMQFGDVSMEHDIRKIAFIHYRSPYLQAIEAWAISKTSINLDHIAVRRATALHSVIEGEARWARSRTF